MFTKGHIVSDITRKKISDKLKVVMLNKWQNPEFREHMSKVHKGQISFMQGKYHSEKTKAIIREKRSKQIITKETKIKISLKLKGMKKPFRSEEHRKNISIKRRGKSVGLSHWNWKGGVSKYRERYYSIEYKDWRREVFVRDSFTCQKCGKQGGRLNAHHIKLFSKYPELKFNLDNGKTFCRQCHIDIHRKPKLAERHMIETLGTHVGD